MNRTIRIYNIETKSGEILGSYFNIESAKKDALTFTNVVVVETTAVVEMK